MSCCLIDQKRILGSQDLVSGHKVKRFRINPHSNASQVRWGYCLKIVLLNFTKLSVEFSLLRFEHLLPGRPYNSMQNQYRVNYQKRGNH